MGQIIDLFSGAGGFSLAGHWNGWHTVAFCEINKKVWPLLNHWFPGIPIHDDIKTLNREKLIEYGWNPQRTTIVCAGFPCQPASVAGKRKGQKDNRWLWPETLRIIDEVRPDWIIAENVPGLLSLCFAPDGIQMVDQKESTWVENSVFESICEDLEKIGYSVQTFIVPACAVGALHNRERLWIVANSNSNGFVAPEVERVNGSDDGRCPERTQESFKADRNFSRVRTEFIHQDPDTDSARREKPESVEITSRPGIDPGIFCTKYRLDWNPDRSEILRAGYGIP